MPRLVQKPTPAEISKIVSTAEARLDELLATTQGDLRASRSYKREMLIALRPKLLSLRERKASWTYILATLEQYGISVSRMTLVRSLSDEKPPRARPKRAGTTKAIPRGGPSGTDGVATNPPAPQPRRRSRTSPPVNRPSANIDDLPDRATVPPDADASSLSPAAAAEIAAIASAHVSEHSRSDSVATEPASANATPPTNEPPQDSTGDEPVEPSLSDRADRDDRTQFDVVGAAAAAPRRASRKFGNRRFES